MKQKIEPVENQTNLISDYLKLWLIYLRPLHPFRTYIILFIYDFDLCGTSSGSSPVRSILAGKVFMYQHWTVSFLHGSFGFLKFLQKKPKTQSLTMDNGWGSHDTSEKVTELVSMPGQILILVHSSSSFKDAMENTFWVKLSCSCLAATIKQLPHYGLSPRGKHLLETEWEL